MEAYCYRYGDMICKTPTPSIEWHSNGNFITATGPKNLRISALMSKYLLSLNAEDAKVLHQEIIKVYDCVPQADL